MEPIKTGNEIRMRAYVWVRRKELEYNIKRLKQWLVDHHDASITAIRHVRDLLARNEEALDLLNKESI